MMHLGFKNEFPSFIMGGNYFKRRKRGKIQNCLGVKILSSFARLFFLKVVHQLSKNVILSVWPIFFKLQFFNTEKQSINFRRKKGMVVDVTIFTEQNQPKFSVSCLMINLVQVVEFPRFFHLTVLLFWHLQKSEG